jgi:hypothetical protein
MFRLRCCGRSRSVEGCYVNIIETVVVPIADRNTLAVASFDESRVKGLIGELKRAMLTVDCARWFGGVRFFGQFAASHKNQIHQSVPIKIESADTTACRFENAHSYLACHLRVQT